jgi:hypothetical protein
MFKNVKPLYRVCLNGYYRNGNKKPSVAEIRLYFQGYVCVPLVVVYITKSDVGVVISSD